MSNENLVPSIFEHEEFGQVRVVIIDGEPWFVGKDVAVALGYADPFGALKKHVDEEDRTYCQIDSGSRGLQNTTVINESGVYSLILRSELPKAREFKRWLTSVLLPTLRKTGSYTMPGATNTDAVILAKAQEFRLLAELTKNRLLREGLIRQAATLLTGKETVEIENHPYKNFIENFIERFCVRKEKESITRHDFLEKLRIECAAETAKLTDNALTSATKKIDGIFYSSDKLGNNCFKGIKWRNT